MQDTERLFIAIKFTPEIQQNLSKLIANLRIQGNSDLKWVLPENIHLTLKFIGDTPTQRIKPIRESMFQASRSCLPFTIALKGTGCFPSAKQPRIFWVGLEAPENFYHLQRKIELSLIPLGISEEKRAFSPHLTLARIPVQHDCKLVNQVYERLLAYNREEFGNMTVNQVTLFQSTLTRDGPIYHSLAEIPLPESI